MKLPPKNKTDSSPRQVIQTPSDADGVKGGGIYGWEGGRQNLVYRAVRQKEDTGSDDQRK